MRLNLERTVDK